MKFEIVAIIISHLLLLLLDIGIAQPGVQDISKFGGKPNSDITQALISAWKEACASSNAVKIVIPSGSYKMGAVEIRGPCKAPIEIEVNGTINAPINLADLNGTEQWIKIQYVDFLTISGHGVFDGQGAAAWKLNHCGKNKHCNMMCMNFGFFSVRHSIMRGITSKDSKIFHVSLLGCNNFTFDGINIKAPRNSLNTEGIHIKKSTNIKILDTKIGTGDDCISLGDGTKNVTVESLYCGPGGHGISVGSLGKFPNEEPVEGLFVKSCTLTNTDFGLRIRTWPDTPSTITVSDLHFQDILMINVKNPVFIDQEYCPWNQCTNKQNPSKIKISKVTFKNIRGTSATQVGVVLNCSSVVPCEGVELTDVTLKFNGAAAMAKCVNVKPLLKGKAPICTP